MTRPVTALLVAVGLVSAQAQEPTRVASPRGETMRPEIRGANAADSWEARIITAIDAARDEVETDRNGTRFVPVEVLMEAINADVAPRDQRTTYWVAKQLRLLSWTVTRMGRARKLALVADDELLERLVAAYSAPREEENA